MRLGAELRWSLGSRGRRASRCTVRLPCGETLEPSAHAGDRLGGERDAVARQLDRERRADARFALEVDGAPVRPDDLVSDEEPEPEPRYCPRDDRPLELSEDAGLILRGDPYPFVRDGESAAAQSAAGHQSDTVDHK